MTDAEKERLRVSKQIGDAIMTLSMMGVMTAGERQRVEKRYFAWAKKNGITVQKRDVAGRLLASSLS